MKIEEIEIEKLKELKEKSMMLNDKRQKGKVTYKIWDIVVVAILALNHYSKKLKFKGSSK